MIRMIQIKKDRRQRPIITIALVTVLIGVLFYALNYYTPLYADDYSYSFSFSTGERMETPAQIVDSQIGHYKIL